MATEPHAYERPTLLHGTVLPRSAQQRSSWSPWLELMETGDPESVAVALRLFQFHLMWTIEKLGPTLAISEAEAALPVDRQLSFDHINPDGVDNQPERRVQLAV